MLQRTLSILKQVLNLLIVRGVDLNKFKKLCSAAWVTVAIVYS